MRGEWGAGAVKGPIGGLDVQAQAQNAAKYGKGPLGGWELEGQSMGKVRLGFGN